jgi:hypothetical protein
MGKLFFILVLTMFVNFVKAEVVQADGAKTIALNWINSRGGEYYELEDIGLVYSKVENKVPLFYIVTFGTIGWVIVSGFDAVEPVLGFSLDSKFDFEQMPPQVNGWMGGVTSEIELAIKNKLKPSSDIKQRWQAFGGKLSENQNFKSIQNPQSGPLLSTTWNQGRFYNEMAPIDPTSSAGNGHVWIGCVATAMAQVMKYWEYPLTGMGFHSYSHPEYGTQSANFANTSYNWEGMPDNASSLNEEIEKISYQCAVSVNMDFGPGASGAYLSGEAFTNFFRYNSTIFEADKAQWSDSEWNAQLKRDIDAGRPVVYSGYNSSFTSGHAWVCDGYSDNYFHFNWGWSGAYNGYFLLSALNPGSNNYSYSQAALFSIEPVNTASIPIPYSQGFETGEANGICLMGVSEILSNQTHTGTKSLKLGKESILLHSTNAASLCFLVPADAELNFWVKRFTPEVSNFNQQKALILPQYGSTPIMEIYNGDFNDADWVGYNVNLSAYSGQVVRLLFLQDVDDYSKQQWMYIDDISISGISNNLAPYTPSNPNPSDQAGSVDLDPTLHWSGGDPNGDGLTYKIYLGTSETPPLIASVFDNKYKNNALNHTTTYFWKIISDDGILTTEGPTWSFTTRGIPPAMENCGISNLTSTSMDVCGKISDYNKTTVSSRGICWSQTKNPSLSTDYIKAAGSDDLFSCKISGLFPYEKYYYCAYAASNQGEGYSEILSVTTLPSFPEVSIDGVENVLRSSVIVKGKIITLNDSSIISRGIVWSKESGFTPQSGHVITEYGNWKEPASFNVKVTDLPGPGTFFIRLFAENSVGISYSDELMIVTLNRAPFIDLDANNSKGAGESNFFGSSLEQLPGGVICDTDVEIMDPDGDTIKQMEVRLVNAFNSEMEFVTILSGNNNLIIEGNGTRHLKISSSVSLSNASWKEVLRSIEYRNNLDSPHLEIIRQIQILVSDGFDNSNLATAYLIVIPVNDPPVVQVLPSLDTDPVYGSSVVVRQGSWADLFDECEGSFTYSYSWQMKDFSGNVIKLSNDNQRVLLISDSLCGSSIRLVEEVTDNNCGGTNKVVNQAASQWYLVGKASQTIILDQVPVHDFKEAIFTLNGKASSGLPITFSVPENRCISISNDTAYIHYVGTVVISGMQPGNECYLPSMVSNKIVSITRSKQKIICEDTLIVKYKSNPMKIPATATSGLGLVLVSSDSSVAIAKNDTLLLKGTGQVTLSISQPGNQNYYSSDTTLVNLIVLKGDQSITTQYPDDLIFGTGRFPFNAFSSAQLNVELSSSDPSVVEIIGDSLIIHGVGEVLILAKQAGDSLWNPAEEIVIPLKVKKGIQEIFVDPIQEKIVLDNPFTPVFYSNSGLDVVCSVRDTTIADVKDGKIVIKRAGETVIDFIQSGNQYWEPVSIEAPFRVKKVDQEITFHDIDNQLFGIEWIELPAISSSGLKVEFEISDQEVGTISGDSLFIHNAGASVITAIQTGNDQYNPAISVSVNLLVEKASQSIISNLPDTVVFGNQIIFANVVSTSGLKVEIFSSDEGIAKVITDSLQILGPGEVLLTLIQSGNRNFFQTESIAKLVVSEPVLISSKEESRFSLFPNPTAGKTTLVADEELNYPLNISIVNSTGKTISNFETKTSINRLDLSNQAQGLYFIVVRSRFGFHTQKLLLAR